MLHVTRSLKGLYDTGQTHESHTKNEFGPHSVSSTLSGRDWFDAGNYHAVELLDHNSQMN